MRKKKGGEKGGGGDLYGCASIKIGFVNPWRPKFALRMRRLSIIKSKMADVVEFFAGVSNAKL